MPEKRQLSSRCSLLLLIFCLLLIMPQQVWARSYDFPQITIEAEITPEGDMWVTEQRTVNFNGTFHGLSLWIKTQNPITISNVEVAENNLTYTFNPGTEYGPAGTYMIKDEADRFLIDWSFDATNTNRTFTVRYRVNDVVQVHDDVAELYYQFIGGEWEVAAHQVKVNLHLPEKAAVNEIRAWGHGPLYGEVQIPANDLITWEIEPLPAYTFLEGRVTFPPSLVPLATHSTGKAALPDILAEEEQWADQANREREEAKQEVDNENDWRPLPIIPRQSPLLPYLAAFILLGSSGFAFWAWYRYGKEFKPNFSGDYYRELPADYTPAELGVLWRFGKTTTEDLTATLIDLARKGFLQIEEVVVEKRSIFFGSKKEDYRVIRTAKQASLAEHEEQLLDFLFTRVSKDNAFTFDELEDYAKKHASRFRSFWTDWQNTVSAQSGKLDFFDTSVNLVKGIVIVVGILMLPLGLLMANLLTPAFIIGGIIIVISGFSLNRRSRNGVEQFVRWRAFRKFLLDFSNMESHELPSLVIWEHYMVYAITLGVAKEVIKQLQLVFPLESDGQSFGNGWFMYSGAYRAASFAAMTRSFDKLNQSFNETVRIASSPPSSGSGGGGGFSGGGGFGGGGGGGGFGGGGGSAR
ncbi:MAG TPA: DUF2207 domain-containing protein [Oscillospiraceae bacterium]|nr:DUF2207 domain-containing protein [Oscillospiraceae bacterium]